MKVAVCGSGRFKPLIRSICDDLRREGFVVLEPPLHDMAFSAALPREEAALVWKGATLTTKAPVGKQIYSNYAGNFGATRAL
jgi:hypothetical protein